MLPPNPDTKPPSAVGMGTLLLRAGAPEVWAVNLSLLGAWWAGGWSCPQGADGSAGAWRPRLPCCGADPGCRLSVSAVGIEFFDSQARVLV